MIITQSRLRKIIKEEAAYLARFLNEDSVDPEGTRYTVDKARNAEEPGMMGIDPADMKNQILEQFSTTANSLVNLLKDIRIMREMAAEMSQMEAEDHIPGDFGTKMWHGVSSVDRLARSLVKRWNKLNNIK